jgi:hypothetical protein
MARKAFIMGSNGTPAFGVLKYAREDADAIAEVLGSSRCGFQLFRPDHDADAYDLRRQLNRIVTSCSADDTFICYFSGHGELDKGELFLIWEDTTEDLFTTALPARHLLEAMQRCPARNKLLVLDCCHAGGAVGAKGPAGIPVQELRIEPENHLLLMASGRLEKARELDHLGGSFLTTSICQALGSSFHDADRDQDDRISIEDLKAWLEERAAEHNASSAIKVPVPHFFGHQQGDFYLTADASAWSPYEIGWPDGSTLVILPVHPMPTGLHGVDLHAMASLDYRSKSPGSEMAFALGKYPVTNEQYRRFLKETRPDAAVEPAGESFREGTQTWVGDFYPWRDPDFNGPAKPVVCVAYNDAQEYCLWANSIAAPDDAGVVIHLPSFEMWDHAAYGTEFPNLNPQSWMGQTRKLHHQAASPSLIDTSGERTNARGLSDMFGNVWEWCGPAVELAILENHGLPGYLSERRALGRPSLRGGSFLDNLAKVEPRLRASELRDRERTRHSDLGFRIAAMIPVERLPPHIRSRLAMCRRHEWGRAADFAARLGEGSDF